MRHSAFLWSLVGLCVAVDPGDLLAQQVELIFRCDMTIQEELGVFDPSFETVSVRGQLNAWGCSEMTDADGDGVWEYREKVENLAPNVYEYKFNIACSERWEGDPNKLYTVTGSEPDSDGDGYGELVIERFYNDLDFVPGQQDVEVIFRADMRTQIALGLFDPITNSMAVRGEFNSWGCDSMVESDDDGVYEYRQNFDNLADGRYLYKFNIDCSDRWETGENRAYVVDSRLEDADGDGYRELLVERFFDDLGDTGDFFSEDVRVVFSVDLASVRKAFDAGATVDLVTLPEPLTSFEQIETVGVTGPFADWNWSGFSEEQVFNDLGEDFDEVAGDGVFTGAVLFRSGTSRRVTYKYGLNGFDVEAGFQQDHEVVVDVEDDDEVRLATDCFGSRNEDIRLPWGLVEGGFDCSSGVGPFVRGDSNSDSVLNISDASFTLNFLFNGGITPVCRANADANADGLVNIADASFSLNFLFQGGNEPPAPFPACAPSEAGLDLDLGCETPVCAP